MRRSLILRCAFGSAVALFLGSIAVPKAAADAVSDQQAEVKQVVAEIDRLHERVDQLNEEYVSYLNQKSELEGEIAIAQQKIAEQQALLGTLQAQLASVAVEKVMGGGSGVLAPLFTDPVAIDEDLQRDHLARVAVNAGAASTDDYETLLDQLATETRSLEKKQQKALDLAQAAEDARVKAEDAAKALEDRLVTEKAKLGDLLEQEQQREIDAANAEYARQVADAQAKAAQSGGGGGGGSTGSSGNSNSGSDDSTSDGGSGGGGDGDGGASVPPVSSRASVAVNAAMSQLGVPYKFASSSPGVAFDCSGLTAYAWSVAGVGLPHQSASQYASVPHVPKELAQPGDLIFYYSPISHVGIYLGGSSMVHSPHSGKTVEVTAVRWNKVVGVGRPG